MTRTNDVSTDDLRPDAAELSRLLGGEHHDPHSILGAHEYADHTVIRVLRPNALEVVALVGAERYPFSHVEDALFAVAIPFTGLIDYRLEVRYPGADGTPHAIVVADPYRFLPTLGEVDLHLFSEGRHERLWEVLGAHPRTYNTPDGPVEGVSFAVWAPNAKGVSLIGEFNHWSGVDAPMRTLGSTGVWELFWPGFPVAHCTSSRSTAPTASPPNARIRWRSPPRSRRCGPPGWTRATTPGAMTSGCHSALCATRYSSR